MNRTPTLRIALLTLLALALALITAAAQEAPAPLLTLTSPDRAHPVQFQVIAPGDAPITAAFVSHLEFSDPLVNSTWNTIYVAVNNTGWSEGVVGLSSGLLDPEGQYVALEVDADGVPVEGGLIFDLVYDEDLGEDGGFTLHVLISRTRRFGIFPAGVEDGQPFPAFANIREADGAVSRIPVGVSLETEPESIFAPLVLEFHIVARVIPTAVPEVDEAADVPPVAGGRVEAAISAVIPGNASSRRRGRACGMRARVARRAPSQCRPGRTACLQESQPVSQRPIPPRTVRRPPLAIYGVLQSCGNARQVGDAGAMGLLALGGLMNPVPRSKRAVTGGIPSPASVATGCATACRLAGYRRYSMRHASMRHVHASIP